MKRRTYPVQKTGASPYTKYEKTPYFYSSEDRPLLKDSKPFAVARGKSVRHLATDISYRFRTK